MSEREIGLMLTWGGILLVVLFFTGPTLWHDWEEERRARKSGQNGDAKLRQVAARALGELGEPRAVEPLIATLQDESHLVRQEAAESLGRLGDSRAVAPLLEILSHDSELEVRYTAAEALGRLHDAHAADALISILSQRPIIAKANG